MSWPASKTHTTLSSTLHLRDDHKAQRWDSSRSQLSTANDSLLGRLSKSAQKVWPSSSVLPLTASTPRRDSNSEKSRPLLRSSTIRSSISTLPARTSFTMPSPETMRFVFLCSLWYTSSALSSNTGKQILNQFKYPVSLTFVQFGFVAGYCLLFMSPVVRFTTLRRPTKRILTDTLPMGLFQVGGHIFSSMAISRIPVSTVHTIKALSPLFTVAAYALLFGVRYTPRTYMSLLPLTAGVMLACTFDMTASNTTGLLCAFGSAIVFVTSNIFFKKIMPTTNSHADSHHHQKLDKLNLLFYSSFMAFLLMIPIWLYTDMSALLAMSSDPDHVTHPSHAHTSTHSVMFYFIANGTVHFAQNIIAFIILASVSPVTYSIASLIKRVAVICMAFVWFAQDVHPIQGLGIALAAVGLWMYNEAKGDVEKGENKRRGVEARREGMLPSTWEDEKMLAAAEPEYATIGGTGGPGIGGMRIETEGLQLDGMGVSLASGRTMALAQPTSSSPSSAHPPAFSPNGNGTGHGARTRMETNAPLHEPQPQQTYYNDPPPFNPSSSHSHAHGHNHSNTHSHSHHWHAHHPAAANLHITVPPPPSVGSPVGFVGSAGVGAKGTLSPHDSYPSPPPSLDSPPMTAKGLHIAS